MLAHLQYIAKLALAQETSVTRSSLTVGKPGSLLYTRGLASETAVRGGCVSVGGRGGEDIYSALKIEMSTLSR